MKKLILTFVIFFIVFNFSYALIIEEEIFNEKSEKLSLYSLSNDISEIENAIKVRTRKIVKLSDVGWSLSSNIPSNVKDVMNRLNLNYSMATYLEYSILRIIIVYRRVGDQWFTCSVF